VIFEQRAKALIDEFKASDTPRFLIADSKLYGEKSRHTLAQIPFITRIPGSLKLEQAAIDQALSDPLAWMDWDKGYRYQRLGLCHYGMEQRWLVIHSKVALDRAKATLDRQQEKEHQRIKKALFHLQAQRFDSKTSAEKALTQLTNTWKMHQLKDISFTEHKRYAKKGRPNAQTPIEAIEWQIHASYDVDQAYMEAQAQHKACFVLGTNIADNVLTDFEVFQGYKSQSNVEGGFRFLKDPLFFVSSLFLKKPSRIEALLMVMTLSLFVYSIAQRRLRANLQAQNQTLPNQIDQPTKRPTLRWVFQLFEGIHLINLINKTGTKTLIDRLSDLRQKILRLLGPSVCRIYQISMAGG